MAIVGFDGQLRLRRETPDPLVLPPPPTGDPPNSIQAGITGIWSGDQVTISSPVGLPLLDVGGVPLAPRGMGIPPSTTWYRSPAWSSAFGPFDLATLGGAPIVSGPWERGAELLSSTAYASFDQTGRISFYTTRAGALNGEAADRLPLGAVNFGQLTVTPFENEWLCMADLTSWQLELDSASADTTGLGGKFGESVKALVTGSGSLEFMIDRRGNNGIADATMPLRLLLMLEKGCKAQAEFWMIEDRKNSICDGLLPGDLYYTADLLVIGTGAGADTQGRAMLGSARFATTGEIRLKMGV